MGKIQYGWIMCSKWSLVYNFIFYQHCFENLGELLKHVPLVGIREKSLWVCKSQFIFIE